MIWRISFALPLAISFTLAVALAGCGSHGAAGPAPASGNGTGSSSSSSVTTVMPASGATGVALNATIQIVFSSPVTSSTVNSSNIQVGDSNLITGTVTYDAGNDTATFTPSADLAPNTEYTVAVSGITSSSGTAVGSFTSSFTTANDNVQEYQATLFPSQGVKGAGQVSILTCGCLTIQMTGAQATTSYTLNFCPAYPSGSNPSSCIPVASFETDGNGDANQDLHFPQAGRWAGDFQLDAGSTVEYSTTLVSPTATGGGTQVYMAALQPLNTVNDGKLQPAGTAMPQSLLNTGTVTWGKGTLQFSITGGAADTSYTATENIDALGGSSSYQLNDSQKQSAFTSDANGNLSFSVLQDGGEGDLFELVPENNQAGYIGGFSIPQ